MPARALPDPANIRAVLLELLRELDEAAAGSPRAFYDRICEGICSLTVLERCALLLYSSREKRVLPAGSAGIDERIVAQLHGTLDETPLAARALAEDRVIVTTRLADAIPQRHRGLPGVHTLACVPVAAGDRWLGVLLCDRGGGEFDLSDEQRDLMWALGKTAALAATTRMAIAEQERAKLLSERVALAREVHERVMQRLFGISLVLGSGEPLAAGEQERVAAELQAALADLRAALQRNSEPAPPPPSPSLAAELERLRGHYPGLRFEVQLRGEDLDALPSDLDALAQAVLAEALHNADKHAEEAMVTISARTLDGTFELEVRNDGVDYGLGSANGARMGLRLAAFEALQKGGVLEFGPAGSGRWRVRLLLPLRTEDSGKAGKAVGDGR